ncbi:MAG: VWA domain-containing protein [Acidobacteria bacterium]|nr:VWA domain-containing protein [Acidobacteriota bacterium]
MKFTRIPRLFLLFSLVLAGTGIALHNRASFLVPAPVLAQEQDEPMGQASISVSVDMVTLQVLVTDNKGNALTGLKPENFTIYEDNVKQEIKSFSPVDANITVVMLVEYSNNIQYFIDEVWNAMYGFANTLRPGDWAAVIGYDMNTRIMCDFTQNRQELYKALRQFMYPSFWESNLSDALIETLDRTQELEGKVAVLLISTGLDTFSRHTYDDALRKCKEANASVYAIGLGQHFRIRADAAGVISQEENLDLLMGDNRLKSFADLTGGAAYFPRFPTELPAIFNNISQLLRSQYSIAYVSSNTKKDGKYRKIKVDVKTDLTDNKGKPLKLKVVTRKGYYAREL